MTDLGEPSQVREEEPRDIHTVWEQLVPREPSPLVTVEGRELLPESDPEEESEEEEDPEELPHNITEAELFDELYDRSIELQDKVEELEGQVVEHQTALEQKDATIQDLTSRLAEVEQRLAQSEYRRGRLLARDDIMQDNLSQESAERVRAEDAWLRAADRADRVEREVRSKKAKIDEMEYVFHSTVDRAQERVRRYPVQFEDYPWYMMDRRMMLRIMDQERDEAVRRGLSS